jgi:hypothetical protein
VPVPEDMVRKPEFARDGRVKLPYLVSRVTRRIRELLVLLAYGPDQRHGVPSGRHGGSSGVVGAIVRNAEMRARSP